MPGQRAERDFRAHRRAARFSGASSARAARCALPFSTGAYSEQIGFSAFISAGSMLDVGWGALIDYLGDDPNTRSIVIYMESIGDARSFLSAAREVALNKPIIVIKAGRTDAGGEAPRHRTPDRWRAATMYWRRPSGAWAFCGSTASPTSFYMTEVLANQPRPKGPKLAIVTNAGGPGVIATDALLTARRRTGRDFRPPPAKRSTKCCRRTGATNNPIDIIGDAGPERFEKAVEIVAQGSGCGRAAGDHDTAGYDQSGADRREADALRQTGSQTDPGQLDGRRGSGAGRR